MWSHKYQTCYLNISYHDIWSIISHVTAGVWRPLLLLRSISRNKANLGEDPTVLGYFLEYDCSFPFPTLCLRCVAYNAVYLT